MANWINEEIKIDFSLPKIIVNLIEDLERLNNEEDYAYFNYSETLDDVAKEFCVLGQLTKEQWNLLCLKYAAR